MGVGDAFLNLGVVDDLTKPWSRAVLPALIVVGSLGTALEGKWAVGGAGLAIVAALLQALASYVLANRVRTAEGETARLVKEDELSRSLRLLVNVLESVNPHNAPGQRYRANVMVPVHESPSALIMAYQTAGYEEDANRIEWRAGEGCCGEAWLTNRPQTFPRHDWDATQQPDPHQDNWRYPAGYTIHRSRAQARARAIVSIPLHVPARGDLRLGVLNIDDLACDWSHHRSWQAMLDTGESLKNEFETLLHDIGYRPVSETEASGTPGGTSDGERHEKDQEGADERRSEPPAGRGSGPDGARGA